MSNFDYPYVDGDVIVLGPEIFATPDGGVICWRGENYVRQLPPIPGRHRDTPDPPPVARIGGQPYDPDDVPDRRDVE